MKSPRRNKKKLDIAGNESNYSSFNAMQQIFSCLFTVSYMHCLEKKIAYFDYLYYLLECI